MSSDRPETPGRAGADLLEGGHHGTGAELRFEEALAELEKRVRALEAGEIPLDEALALYEEGVQLARACHEQLEAADRRVAQLSRGSSGIEERPLGDP